MLRRMVVIMVELTGYGSIRHVAISLPYVEAILDHRKYLLPEDVPPPQTRDLRRLRQGKVEAPRAPTLRTVVKWALECDSAEQLGERLRRRY
jgi:hypothetical protein